MMASFRSKVLLRCLRNVTAEMRCALTNNLRCTPAVQWKLNARGFATEGECDQSSDKTRSRKLTKRQIIFVDRQFCVILQISPFVKQQISDIKNIAISCYLPHGEDPCIPQYRGPCCCVPILLAFSPPPPPPPNHQNQL